ncbi:hypothetical protein SNE40_014042 [Patella caerulea]|uniref:Complex I assembly factor TIMMDC1, mitochondrial n=1 Tax=Patella caerulea TaxID=87958 RepID=A0AAN8JHD6_PATCE
METMRNFIERQIFKNCVSENSEVVIPQYSINNPGRVKKRSSLNVFSMFKVYADSFPTPIVTPTATDRMERTGTNTEMSSAIVTEMEVNDYISNETGKDRLRNVITKDLYGEYPFEFKLVTYATIQAGVMSFILASYLASKNYKDEFARKHQATVYSSRFQAMRRFNDAIMVEGIKEGSRMALRATAFTGLFIGTSQAIAVYRNKSSPLEYTIGCVVSCGILRASMGLKGMIAGGAFGAVVGSVAGCLLYGILYSLNETQENRHYWQVHKRLTEEKENKGLLPAEHLYKN